MVEGDVATGTKGWLMTFGVCIGYKPVRESSSFAI